MTAQVPYLAGLARRAAGPAPLQPPRQLFAGAAYPPVRQPAGDSAEPPPGRTGEAAAGRFPGTLLPSQSAEEPPASPRITSQRDGDTSQPGEYTAGNRAGGAPAPVDSAIRAGNAGGPTAPDWPDRHGPAQVTLSPPLAPRAESAQFAAATPATPAPASPIAPPAGQLPPAPSPQPPAHAVRGGPPGSPAIVPLWGAPVELAHSVERAPVTSQSSTRLAAGPALPPSRLGPAATAGAGQGLPLGSTDLGHAASSGPGPAAVGPDQGQFGGGTGTMRTPGGWDAVSDGGRSAAVRELLPLPAQALRSAELAGPGPAGSRQEPPGGPAQARVSIGTIEVTVVPPARPAQRASESRPPAQMARGRSRPPSLLAATPGAGRLRDGLRRWYGIAQG